MGSSPGPRVLRNNWAMGVGVRGGWLSRAAGGLEVCCGWMKWGCGCGWKQCGRVGV